MKSITKCFLFKMQDKALKLIDNMNSYNPILDNLDINKIEDGIKIIEKRYNYPLKNSVIDGVKTGKIIPIFNKERVKVPSNIPSFLIIHPKHKQVTSLCNLTLYSNLTKEGNFNIDTRQLYVLLENAFLSYGCLKNWNSIRMNQSILKDGSLIFSKIFCKVLDKMFALNIDSAKSDKVRYLAAKYFLINILEKAPGTTIDNTAYNSCPNKTSFPIIKNIDEDFSNEDFNSYESFIKALALNIEGFSNLTVRSYLSAFINMYGPSTVMALEYFPAFCFVIFSALIGAHLNAEYILVNLLNKDMDRFYNEVAKLIK